MFVISCAHRMGPSNADFQTIKGRVRKSYAQWGIPSEFFKDNQTTTPETFLKLLERIESRIPEMNCRVMPSSFNPDDENLRAFPYHLSPRWGSCERALRESGSHGVMMRLPLFWQVESNLYHACRAANAFLFLNESENMPLGAAALRLAEIDAVVTDTKDAFAFSLYLSSNNSPLDFTWVIVHTADYGAIKIPEILLQEGAKVIQEVHIFPGVPVLEQCSPIWKDKSSFFHVSDDYILEQIGNNDAITSANDAPLPFFRYELPLRLREEKKCSCGKQTFSIKKYA